MFYDITASNENREIFINIVSDIAENINIPFTIGGGIRTAEDFRKVLLAGADKVSVNSAAVQNPQLISDAAKRFGCQCVVISVDAKRNGNKWEVYINGGRVNTGIDAIEWAVEAERLGAGEICINSIDSDGIKEGFDLELIERLNSLLTIPIIASGGAGTIEHFSDVLNVGADAALAASVFHYDEIQLKNLKDYLYSKNIPIRRL